MHNNEEAKDSSNSIFLMPNHFQNKLLLGGHAVSNKIEIVSK